MLFWAFYWSTKAASEIDFFDRVCPFSERPDFLVEQDLDRDYEVPETPDLVLFFERVPALLPFLIPRLLDLDLRLLFYGLPLP